MRLGKRAISRRIELEPPGFRSLWLRRIWAAVLECVLRSESVREFGSQFDPCQIRQIRQIRQDVIVGTPEALDERVPGVPGENMSGEDSRHAGVVMQIPRHREIEDAAHVARERTSRCAR